LENEIPDDDSDDKYDDITQTNSFLKQLYTHQNDLEFLDSHPGKHFCKLRNLKGLVISMIFYDGTHLYSIYNLHIDEDEVNENTHKRQEDYAKIALLMFCPYHYATDMKLSGSHWTLFKGKFSYSKKDNKHTCGQKDLRFYKTSKTEKFSNMTLPKSQIL
jgi:hypothetical protein